MRRLLSQKTCWSMNKMFQDADKTQPKAAFPEAIQGQPHITVKGLYKL